MLILVHNCAIDFSLISQESQRLGVPLGCHLNIWHFRNYILSHWYDCW